VLNGIACPGVKACFAVGSYATSGGFQTLIESWAGSAWSLVTSPNASSSDQLSAVSCSSAYNCTAVGSYDNGGVTDALAV
jgi:hypothetical protein